MFSLSKVNDELASEHCHKEQKREDQCQYVEALPETVWTCKLCEIIHDKVGERLDVSFQEHEYKEQIERVLAKIRRQPV